MPTYPAIGARTKVLPVDTARAEESESGVLRGQDFAGVPQYKIDIEHPLITEADVATLETFHETNSHTRVGTQRLADGHRYQALVLERPRVRDISSIRKTVNQRLQGRRISPVVLFNGHLSSHASGGAWDPSDKASLWQDTSGTTPVAAAGDPVGRIDDQSGLGNHWLQATAAERPTYQVDSDGRGYLDFDGSDDSMSQAWDSVLVDVSGSFGVFIAYQPDQASVDADALLFGNVGADKMRVEFDGLAAAAQTPRFHVSDGGGAGTTDFDYSTAWTDATTYVRGDIFQASTEQRIRINQSEETGGAAYATLDNPNATIYLGGSGTANSFSGRFYGAVIIGDGLPTSDEIDVVETWLQAVSGAAF